jgi:hypothetical protein
MSIVKLKPGEVVIVSAGDPNRPDQGLPKPEAPVDPGYGVDLGLGWLHPAHPIAPGGQPPRPTHPIVKPGEPTHPIVLPPEGPVDPGWGIDEDAGYNRPDNTLPQPMPPEYVPNWEVKTAWTPATGWIVVAVPTGNVPTPSKKR